VIRSGGADVSSPEGYELTIGPERIEIRAPGAAGAFYAVQTLRQLLPPAVERDKPEGENGRIRFRVPCARIVDEPRFSWRGMHFDVGRHFFEKDFILRYIDYLAMHKVNTFHWHLTEDQGWRIDIRRFPKLAEIAAWRDGTWKHRTDGEEDPRRYGGYYTQDEIREVVEYARDRFITVVPEIEMPGHSQAALAAYPELSCTGGPHEVWTKWGISKEVYCAGNDETFEFLEGVLEEVIDLFPSEYIHIGGDECPKDRWKECPKCQARIAKEGLADEHELQSWFIRRIERFVNSRGRRIIGWDEILEGGLAPKAAVMSWRGTAGGIEAARSGHWVVMTPNGQTYFNYKQTRDLKGPGHDTYLPLQKVYAFEPTEGLSPAEAGYVLGAQACLWTEYVPTPEDAEYLLFPRLCAIAEVEWSPSDLRDEADFLRRIRHHERRLRTMGVNFCDVIEKVFVPRPEKPEVVAPCRIETTIPTHGNFHPEYAFDGNDLSYFWSDGGVKAGQHFTIVLDEPILVRSIEVRSGTEFKPNDIVHKGSLQISENGVDFRDVGDFTDGTARVLLGGEKIRGIRIRITDNQSNWLILREFSLD
jgi:hexosaminidase